MMGQAPQRRLNAPRRQNSSASSSERQWQEGLEEQRLDFDEATGPLHGMDGSMETEFEVQRTIERAELTPLYAFSKE